MAKTDFTSILQAHNSIKTLLLLGTLNKSIYSAKSLQDIWQYLSIFKFSALQKVILNSVPYLPEVKPSSPDFHRLFLLYVESLLAQNLFPQAFQILQYLEKQSKNLKSNENLSRFLLCRATCLNGLGFSEAALQSLDQLLQHDSTISPFETSEILLQKAAIYESNGKIFESLEFYEKALEILKSQKEENKTVQFIGLAERGIGKLYHMQGRLLDAVDCLQSSLERLQSVLSRNHPEIGKTLLALAEVYLELGRDEEALEYCQEASVALIQCFEEGSSYIAEYYFVLGKAFAVAGKLDLAKKHFVLALGILKKFYQGSPIDFSLFFKINLGLADVMREQLKHQEAMTLYNECHSIIKAWLGVNNSNHPFSAVVYEGIGKAYFDNLKFSEALAAFENGLESLKDSTPTQYYASRLKIFISQIFLQQAKIKKTFEYLQDGVKTLRKELGDKHYLIAEGFILEGRALQALGKIHDAQQMYIQGLMLMKKMYKSNSHKLWKFYYHIGVSYKIQGKYANAENSLLKALKLLKVLKGERNHELAQVNFQLVEVYFEQAKPDMAFESYKNGMDLQSLFEDEVQHLNFCQKHECIGQIFFYRGRNEKALESFQTALDFKIGFGGESHPDLAEIYTQIAKVHYREKKYEEAADLLRKGRTILENHYGKEHLSLHSVHFWTGKIAMKQANFKEAFEYYNLSLVLVKRAFGNKSSFMCEIYRDFGRIYQIQGKIESAHIYLRMANELQETTNTQEHFNLFRSSLNLGCFYGTRSRFDLGIKSLEKAKQVVEGSKCGGDLKNTEKVESAIKAFKKNIILCQSLDC